MGWEAVDNLKKLAEEILDEPTLIETGTLFRVYTYRGYMVRIRDSPPSLNLARPKKVAVGAKFACITNWDFEYSFPNAPDEEVVRQIVKTEMDSLVRVVL